MKKKLLIFAAIVVVLASIACLSISAAEVASGTCGADGDNLTWVLDDTGTLTISGTGAMANWSYGEAPWYNYRIEIMTVVIKEGVTSIGSDAFSFCESLVSVRIPNSMTSIGNYAFSDCTSLETITYMGTETKWDAITKGSYWDDFAGEDTVNGTYELVLVSLMDNLGASIRPETEDYRAGLRFGASFDKADFGIEGTYEYEGAEVTFGMLIVPEKVMVKAGYNSVEDYYKNCADERTLDVPAKKIYAQDETSVTYTAVVVGIPESAYTTVMCALPYAIVDGEYVFGDEMKASFYDIVVIARETVYSDESIAAIVDEKKKAEMQAMARQLDKIIAIVEENANKDDSGENFLDWKESWN